MNRTAAVALIFLAIAAARAWPAIRYVDASAAELGDGQSWATAYRFLQDALADAALISGGEIRVATGIYLPDRFGGAPNGTGDLTDSFELLPGVALYGGFPPGGGPPESRDPAAWPTVLSGNILELSPEDFTGCGDAAAGAADCFIATPGVTGCVNGPCCAMVCDAVPFCCVTGWDQQCAYAAIDICEGRSTVTADGIGQLIRIDGFTFADGSAVGAGVPPDPYPYYGGGMRVGYAGGPVIIANCSFEGNIAEFGGGLAITGGAVHVVNCAFEGNEAFLGGAAYALYSETTLVNCLVTANTSTAGGGSGTYAESDAVMDLVNCTVVGNASASHGIAAYAASGIANCIFWGNGSTPVYNAGSVSHTCVEGGHPGPGNLDAPPQFVDAGAGDYRLALGSPCLDAGLAADLPQDVADLDGDFDTGEPTPWDLHLADRVVGAAVDMGAVERCVYDLSGDGIMTVEDILALLAAWETDPGGPPDFNGSGGVGIDDLLELLANWTACG